MKLDLKRQIEIDRAVVSMAEENDRKPKKVIGHDLSSAQSRLIIRQNDRIIELLEKLTDSGGP
ncbi:MAG: hypothetical protein AAGA22_01130 [Pseudomonadota bacterium]